MSRDSLSELECVTEMLQEQWGTVDPFGGASSLIKACVLGPFCSGRCERSAGGVGSSVALWLHSVVTRNGALLCPTGLPLQEPCLCSKMYLFSYSFWELCKTKKDEWWRELFFLPPYPPTTSHHHLAPSLSHSVTISLALSSSAYFAADANDLPLCILMQGLSTLSLSSTYKCALIASSPSGLFSCLFEICRLISTSLAKSLQWLEPPLMWASYRRKTGLWGQEPSTLLCPHPLTSAGPRGRDWYHTGCPRVQLWLKASLGSVVPGDKAQGRSTQENNLHADMELSAGRLDSSALLQGCDRRATLSCLLNMFHWSRVLSLTAKALNHANREHSYSFQVLLCVLFFHARHLLNLLGHAGYTETDLWLHFR